VAGFTALAKCREIGLATEPGRTYVLLTIATCVSGLFIFRHGTFGVPHAIAVLTLIVLILAIAAEKRDLRSSVALRVGGRLFGDALPRHDPAVTETATRIPPGAPLAAGPEAPGLRAAVGLAFLVLLIGAALQVRSIRRETNPAVRGAVIA